MNAVLNTYAHQDLFDQSLERRFLHQFSGRLLILLDLSDGHGARPEATLLPLLSVFCLNYIFYLFSCFLNLRVLARYLLGTRWPSLLGGYYLMWSLDLLLRR